VKEGTLVPPFAAFSFELALGLALTLPLSGRGAGPVLFGQLVFEAEWAGPSGSFTVSILECNTETSLNHVFSVEGVVSRLRTLSRFGGRPPPTRFRLGCRDRVGVSNGGDSFASAVDAGREGRLDLLAIFIEKILFDGLFDRYQKGFVRPVRVVLIQSVEVSDLLLDGLVMLDGR
jgi:hypothetical protein